MLPEDPSQPSLQLAQALLNLSDVFSQQDTTELLDSFGFTVLLQEHYDKSPEDPSHTCAFTVALGELPRPDGMRPVLLILIRGTSAGEWYSNFDISPSRDPDSRFSENFLFCAEDVFLSLKDILDQLPEETAIIATGFSRGAACANLLGILLNEYKDPENIYIYTFACPAVIQADTNLQEQNNIFNYINPMDLVPRLPFEKWGFQRAGTDILLPTDDPSLKEDFP